MNKTNPAPFFTWRLRLWGIVQGVGLRPHIVRLARSLNLAGTVQNLGGLVEVWINATISGQADFYRQLLAGRPAPAVFLRQEVRRFAWRDLAQPFAIRSSEMWSSLAFPAPDLPVCADCEAEMLDPANRRFAHPFISCMHCGPRYSILDRLPYDRTVTAMQAFPLCPTCAGEYGEPADRRFHAQTIACPDCGPTLSWTARDQITVGNVMPAAIACLQGGQIIAVKSTGGYHLACDPHQSQAVKRLRRIKQRDHKPFAVLFPDLASIRAYADVSSAQAALLTSPARPIVLLTRHVLRAGQVSLAPDVCADSAYLGAFLPSTPIQIWLARTCGPLVMTSANRSSESLIYTDEMLQVFWQEQPDLAGILGHNRPIRTGMDDSVVRFVSGRCQFIRRARGYVPLAVDLGPGDNLPAMSPMLALGGDLKATAAFYRDGFAWLTPPAGDLGREDDLAAWRHQIGHLQALLAISPALLAADLHPGYLSRQAYKPADGKAPEQLAWQHHQAHVASVLAEHRLEEAVIGVAFDGTGYGPDDTIWGGEFLICQGHHYQRLAHLKPVLLPAGDSGMRDAWRSLAGYLLAADSEVPVWLQESPAASATAGSLTNAPPCLDASRWQIARQALRHRINALPNSSMGRLFDAVCALLGLGEMNHYEGQCGSQLESAAMQAISQHWPAWPLDFSISQPDPDRPASSGSHMTGDGTDLAGISGISGEMMIPPRSAGPLQADATPVFTSIMDAITATRQHEPALWPEVIARLALGFHEAVCRMTVTICCELASRTGISVIALSGGVMQNAVLVEMLDPALTAAGLRVYWNEQVAPNDSGICLGQIWLSRQLLATHAAQSQ